MNLLEEIDRTITATPTLWWLGHAGFVIRFASITFYIDPYLSDLRIAPSDVHHADMIFATHAHPRHLDCPAVAQMLAASKNAKLILPKSAADHAHAGGIPYERMSTTDSGLRIEYFKDNLYARVYAVPSAHPHLDWTQANGYPYLGYLIRFGRWTIYHAGDGVPYPELAAHLRPFNVNVALLPIGDGSFPVSDAAQLAADIGAAWVAPYGTFSEAREAEFVTHMLGHRPAQRFHVFQPGQKWTVPED